MACQGQARGDRRLLKINKNHASNRENVRSAAARCGSHETERRYSIPGNPKATTRISREWVCPDCDYFEEAEEEQSCGTLARADCQQDFLAEGILELFELQRRLALVAQHFEHGRTALLGHFHAAIFKT